MLDTRRHLIRIFKHNFKISPTNAAVKFIISFLLAFFIVYVPEYNGLGLEASYMYFILVFAAFLWITEAIPAFAVSFLVIALEILFLGFHDLNFNSFSKDWVYYLKPWASPLIFLFMAGFILAIAASKTKLDLWLAKRVVFYFGNKPANLLSGLLLITFTLSMFVSNTATTAMMMTMLMPIIKNMKEDNPFQKGILIGIVVAANIGGMGTIIGTPPNAIAVGILGDSAPTFLGWMMIALPPAILLVIILRYVILKLYPSNEEYIDISKIKNVRHYDDSTTDFSGVPNIPSWKKSLVIFVFMATIILWLTGPFHHIPTTVVALLPIVIFTIFGIIDVEDINEIRWDVIILIIGGLSLGLGVSKTGLDVWLGSEINLANLNIYIIGLVFSFVVVLLSNFMSNTAATNIFLPLVIALVSSYASENILFVVISIALCASCAMLLPVSTPPNAIAFASGKLKSKDFLIVGSILALLGPLMIILLIGLFH